MGKGPRVALGPPVAHPGSRVYWFQGINLLSPLTALRTPAFLV